MKVSSFLWRLRKLDLHVIEAAPTLMVGMALGAALVCGTNRRGRLNISE